MPPSLGFRHWSGFISYLEPCVICLGVYQKAVNLQHFSKVVDLELDTTGIFNYYKRI